MPTVTDLIDAFRDHLIAEGIVRDPGTAGSLPPLWRLPDGGAVAPGDKKAPGDDADIVLSIFHGGSILQAPYEQSINAPTLDLWFRVRQPRFAFDKESEVQAEIVGDIGKRNWSMAGLQVLYSSQWAGLRPIDSPVGQGRAFVASYLFELWRP